MIGVLALQGDFHEHLAALTRCDVRVRPVRRPEDLDGLDGIVLPGGESTTMDKLTRIFELRDPLVTALRAGLPAFGSCAGMILLADEVIEGTADQQTLGGLDISVRRNAFGRQSDSFESDVTVSGILRPVHAVFIRAPWVERVGPGVEVLGTVQVPDHEEPHVVVVRQGPLLATSFHPEVTDDLRVHRYFLDLVRRS
ncbi:MAG TPA: pyridoxal 5'-phosphate synthase glutaminase subunit PdxT [Propionibacteriaceae bacterium]